MRVERELCLKVTTLGGLSTGFDMVAGARGAASVATGANAAGMKAAGTLEAERDSRNLKDYRRSHRLRTQPCPLRGHQITRASQQDGETDRESCE